MLPGVPPTGKKVRVPFVVCVKFEGSKLQVGTQLGAAACRRRPAERWESPCRCPPPRHLRMPCTAPAQPRVSCRRLSASTGTRRRCWLRWGSSMLPRCPCRASNRLERRRTPARCRPTGSSTGAPRASEAAGTAMVDGWCPERLLICYEALNSFKVAPWHGLPASAAPFFAQRRSCSLQRSIT